MLEQDVKIAENGFAHDVCYRSFFCLGAFFYDVWTRRIESSG